jgi:hypothetical protein
LLEFVDSFDMNQPLAKGTYWLALHNGPLTTTNRAEFYWEDTSLMPRQTWHKEAPFTGDFQRGFGKFAFNLSGPGRDLPDGGASSLLLGIGLVGLVWFHRVVTG